MIVYEDKNRVGHDAAQDLFSRLMQSSQEAKPIERASLLYGMLAFCRQQLECELTAAVAALENCVAADAGR